MKLGKALITAFAIIALCLVGCEDKDSSSPVDTSVESYSFSATGIVEHVNWQDESATNRTYVLESGETLIVSDSTLIMVLRPSNSGYALGNIRSAWPGDSVKYVYYIRDVNYNTETITPFEVWVQ